MSAGSDLAASGGQTGTDAYAASQALQVAAKPRQRGGTGAAQGFDAKHPRTAKGRTGGGQFAVKSQQTKQSGGRVVKTPRTPAEIAAFQKSRGLPVTGKLDAKTQTAIANAQQAARQDAAAKAAKAGAKGKRGTVARATSVKLGPGEWAKAGMGSPEHPNARVAGVQRTLDRLGYDVGVTGVFGVELTKAVRLFQQNNRLPVTGIVDVRTRRFMEVKVGRIDAGKGEHAGLTADTPGKKRRRATGNVKPVSSKGVTGEVAATAARARRKRAAQKKRPGGGQQAAGAGGAAAGGASKPTRVVVEAAFAEHAHPRGRDGKWVPLHVFEQHAEKARPGGSFAAHTRWNTEVAHAVAHGELSPAEAAKLGLTHIDGVPIKDVKPLPSRLYHASSAVGAIHASGGLKSRHEMGGKQGLGGGSEHSISFTDSRANAEKVARQLETVRSAASGEQGFEDFARRADKGDGAKHPFGKEFRALVRADTQRVAQGVPEERLAPKGAQPDESIFAQGWKPDESTRFVGPNGKPAWRRFTRTPTKAQRDDARAAIGIAYLKARGEAGGEPYAFFAGGGLGHLASVKAADVGVVEVAPIKGAHGHEITSESVPEFRAFAGSTVKLVKARKVQEAEVDEVTEAALFTGRLHPRDRAGRFRVVKTATGSSSVELAKAEKARARRRERIAQRARHRGGQDYNAAAQRFGYGTKAVKRYNGREDSMMGDLVLEAFDYFEALKLRLIREGRSEGEAVGVAVAAGESRFGADFPEMVGVGRELFEAELVEAAEDAGLVEALQGPHESLGHGKNWVSDAGGLPAAISRLARDLMEKRGMPKSRAIAMAIGIMKRWARGGGGVKPKTAATAAAAVAEWEAMKAKAHAKP